MRINNLQKYKQNVSITLKIFREETESPSSMQVIKTSYGKVVVPAQRGKKSQNKVINVKGNKIIIWFIFALFWESMSA